MLNTNYMSEIMMAQNFIQEHKDDVALNNLLTQARDRHLTHSERWSLIFDWMGEHYPNIIGPIVTGLTYSCEA